MLNSLIYIWTIVFLLGSSAVAGLIWAVASGQFHALQQTADSIFDDDEPIGQPTDAFPQQTNQEESK
ncbi:MAG: cbb3-type cytochrome oxidase assembly protein CcoS [Planctomycetota bacterium]